MKEKIPSNSFKTVKDSILNTLSSNQENIRIFILCLTFNRGLDPIKEYIENEDEDEGGNSDNEKTNQKKREYFTYKYTSNKYIYEAILIKGKPYFITFKDQELVKVEQIEQETRILKPPHEEDYIYSPISFESVEEIERFIDTCQNLTIDSLFSKINWFVLKFIVQHKYVIDHISALIVFSYFQDKFPTVPYTMFVSVNGSGKSSIGDLIEILGYRCVNMTDPTTANVYRIFGKIETGQCILVLDQVDKIDQSEMMSVLKSGYERNKTITRTNNQTGAQEHFYAFGLKILLGERTPDPSRASGVLDRTFIISNYKGKPELDIKEIKNAVSGRNLIIKQQLEFLRKSLMIYRLIHFNDEIADIETGLEGRDKELGKPILQVFFGNQSVHQVEKSIERLVNEKHDRKANSLERDALEVIVDLFNDFPDGIIPFSAIWQLLTDKTNGHVNEYKSHQLETESHGTIYKTPFAKMLRDKFGAKDPKNRNSAVRSLFFDTDKTRKLLESYTKGNGPITVKCSALKYDNNDSSDSSPESLFDNFWDLNNIEIEELNVNSNLVDDFSNKNESEVLVNVGPFTTNKSEIENDIKLNEYDYSDRELDGLKESVIREFVKLEEKKENIDEYKKHKLVKHVKLTNSVADKEIVQTNGSTVKMTREMAEKVINKLLKEGKLVEPKNGYYYRTINSSIESAGADAAAAA